VFAFCNQLAKRFYHIRLVLWFFGIMSVLVFAGVLFLADSATNSSYALASLTALLWALWMLAFAYGFVEGVPVIDPAAHFLTRLRMRLKLGFLWVLATVLAGLMVVAVVLTFRAIGILLDA